MQQIIYTASPDSEQIHVWQLQAQGDLVLLQTVEARGQVQPLAINDKASMLYAGVRPDFRVVAWHIDHEGKLSFAGETALPGSATHLSVDHQAKRLFVAYYHDGQVSISPLDQQGRVGAPAKIIGGLAGCHSTNPDNMGRYLYVPALKHDLIAVLDLTATDLKGISQHATISTGSGSGPRHMAMHGNGQIAYVVNELDSTVLVLKLNDNGAEILQTVDLMPTEFEGTRWAADIHLTANNQYLYACDRTSSLITCFAVSDNGERLEINGYYPTETQPRGFNIDKTGQFLFAVGQKSDSLAVYKIGEKGQLTEHQRYPVGQGAMWVAVHVLAN